jgi:hypothetical protein
MSYSIDVSIKGISPLLHHRFPMPDFSQLSKGGKVKSGEKDYTQEWRSALYVNSNNELYQPSTHLDGALVRAAGSFRVQGRGSRTYSQLFKGNVFVAPDEISMMDMIMPENLDTDGDKPLYLDVRPVVIQRARIVRIRPCFKSGWELDFVIEVIDDQIPANVVNEVLIMAGKTVGIGDFRPKFGRFMVTHFDVVK